jgi:hypothetical protein
LLGAIEVLREPGNSVERIHIEITAEHLRGSTPGASNAQDEGRRPSLYPGGAHSR